MFGETLKTLRKKRKMTQSQLAELFGYSHVAVVKWENGSREPDFATLVKLSEFFCVSTDYLITGSEFKTCCYNVYKALCERDGVEEATVAKELGISKETVEGWKTAVPLPEHRTRIMERFGLKEDPFDRTIGKNEHSDGYVERLLRMINEVSPEEKAMCIGFVTGLLQKRGIDVDLLLKDGE